MTGRGSHFWPILTPELMSPAMHELPSTPQGDTREEWEPQSSCLRYWAQSGHTLQVHGLAPPPSPSPGHTPQPDPSPHSCHPLISSLPPWSPEDVHPGSLFLANPTPASKCGGITIPKAPRNSLCQCLSCSRWPQTCSSTIHTNSTSPRCPGVHRCSLLSQQARQGAASLLASVFFPEGFH